MRIRLRTVALCAALAVSGGGLLSTADAHNKTRGSSGSSGKVAIKGGETTVTLNGATQSALASQGISIAPIAPATAQGDDGIAFPIAGGKVKSANLFGFVGHRGGVKITRGERTLKLRGLIVGNGPKGAFLYVVTKHRHWHKGDGSRSHKARASRKGRRGARRARGRWHRHVKVLRLLALTNVKRADQDGKVVVTADAALTEKAAKVLNRKLDTTLFTAGQAVGTATVSATTK